MSLNMNIVPQNNNLSSINSTSTTESNKQTTKEQTAAKLFSLPDRLRDNQGGAVPLTTQLNDRHPLEARLNNWEDTQFNRQMNQYRQIFGISEPMKKIMDLKLVENTHFNPLNNNAQNIHKDILLNKDCSIDWEDIYTDGFNGSDISMLGGSDMHSKIEHNVGI
ncbi:hypothetical protein TBLA_0B04380 [Henningerozyma blattae CBS 6284]|uniref:Proteasome maturation factor UMP1 n=1 Tax=Henningerozyma blattae (strain ATCC 34711 / CBS 6284 / DSM 70876 / NBRC 10599 / NRRL Y-10934 / UCD 77-7) TaxID=1071380 RepID=I2GYS3_HENB6|nr:hypothetical protein TBLA_0B04380 [Tetrapisispora blattae CBS 6284]CCH59275.1 hypothetical protein TBLA_0B04380 [Tetrapisispora blattae CBS 6284]